MHYFSSQLWAHLTALHATHRAFETGGRLPLCSTGPAHHGEGRLESAQLAQTHVPRSASCPAAARQPPAPLTPRGRPPAYAPPLRTPSQARRRVRFASFPRYLLVQLQRYYHDVDWTPRKLEALVQARKWADRAGWRGGG